MCASTSAPSHPPLCHSAKRPVFFFLFLLACIVAALPASAQSSERVVLSGRVRDYLTGEDLSHVLVTVMAADSTVIDTVNTSMQTDSPGRWVFVMPRPAGNRITVLLRFEKEGYAPAYGRQEARFGRFSNQFDIGITRLHRIREQRLGEATVTATRVQFYMKNDTLVFNADAFQTAEGSMLDALISQLPGVELKDDGRIFVNGRFVESLLLNGEHFFGNDGSVMLQNLPAYTVKDVCVYDKTHWTAPKDKHYVMDVRLKREYNLGWMANADCGLGTEQRYMARVFGLGFTPRTRLSFFGNLNNVNETRRPGTNGEWTPALMPSGLTATKQFGLDYLTRGNSKPYKVQGSLTAQHQDVDTYRRTAGVNFLPAGREHVYSMSRNTNCRTNVNTSHSFQWDRENKLFLNVAPSFRWSKARGDGFAAAAALSADPELDLSALMDSIAAPTAGNLLRRLAVNRQRNELLTQRTYWQASMGVGATVIPISTGDRIGLHYSAAYRRQHQEEFSHDNYEYPAGNGADDFQNGYNDYEMNEFTHTLNTGMNRWYEFQGGRALGLMPDYTFTQFFTRASRPNYSLDELPEWGADAPLGTLPSERAYLEQCLDRVNSYRLRRVDNKHRVAMKAQYEWPYFTVSLMLPLTVRHEYQEYARAAIDTTFRRTTLCLEPVFFFLFHKTRDDGRNTTHDVQFSYAGSYAAPQMVSLLPTLDDNDPLNLRLGNPALKSSYNHALGLRFQRYVPTLSRTLAADLRYNITQNLVAQAFTYNPETGVRTYQPVNVDGNYSLTGSVHYTAPLDRERRLTFSTATDAAYTHSVDLMGDTSEALGRPLAGSQRSVVRTTRLKETLQFGYALGGVRLGVKGSAAWYRATSRRAGFSDINAADYQYGLTVQAALPWQLHFSTDLTMYGRRGYVARGMNADDLVWNARLSRAFLDGRLTVLADGFDILHQLSSTSYAVNGQGQTETFRNVIPRYVMLHIVYKLNIQPRKR